MLFVRWQNMAHNVPVNDEVALKINAELLVVGRVLEG
jgi:hypothetical protein